MEYLKIDDNTLQVSEETTKITKYDYKSLLDRKAKFEKLLAEINVLIAEAGKLGIKLEKWN